MELEENCNHAFNHLAKKTREGQREVQQKGSFKDITER
jgi:hypothetical protein